MHRGLGEYDSMRPCPNGLPIDRGTPGECRGWRERVEKARRDIEKHTDGIALNELGNGAVFASDDIGRLVLLAGRVLNDDK